MIFIQIQEADVNKLATLTDYDIQFYKNNIQAFMPDNIIDCHAHIWLKKFETETRVPDREAGWPKIVAPECSMEQLADAYKTLFPDKNVMPVVFGSVFSNYNIDACNQYVQEEASIRCTPSLMLATPRMDIGILEEKIKDGGFRGIKVYLNQAPSYIPDREIRIYDFLPPAQLEVLDRNGWSVILHIARPNRIKDPVNIGQLMEIDRKYPNANVIVAHVGRAYVDEDLGKSFDVLKHSINLLFEFSANTNEYVIRRLLEEIGSERILFGSDMPLGIMRARRISDDGIYVNLVPKGRYGDFGSDIHMREVDEVEAKKLTYFIYEEIDAFRRASENCGLSKKDINKIFFENAVRVFNINHDLF